MILALRLALRDLRGAFASFRLFLVALAIGVAAIAAVGNVTAAIEAGLARSGAELLGGDAEIELTYRFATKDERAFMESTATRVSEVVSFRSLAVAGGSLVSRRALTEVRGVDDLYPLLGEVGLDPPMTLAVALAGSGGHPGAVMEEDLARRLSLAPGDTFRLGTNEFTLAAILKAWPDDANGGFGFGPRTILRTVDLEGSGLIAEGTLFSTFYRLALPAGADAGSIGAEMRERFPASGLRWRDTSEGLPGTEQVIGRVGAFLMLMGLAGLAIGGVGVSVAVRSWLAARVGTIATLRTLGATRRVIVTAHLAQILIVTLAGIVLGLVLGTLPLLLAASSIQSLLPLPAVFGVYPVPLAQAAVYGGLVALLFALWPLARIEEIRPATLWREGAAAARRLPCWPWLAATGIVLAALILAAILFTGVPSLTLAVFAGMAVTLGLLALAALVLKGTAPVSCVLSPPGGRRSGLRSPPSAQRAAGRSQRFWRWASVLRPLPPSARSRAISGRRSLESCRAMRPRPFLSISSPTRSRHCKRRWPQMPPFTRSRLPRCCAASSPRSTARRCQEPKTSPGSCVATGVSPMPPHRPRGPSSPGANGGPRITPARRR